jgi:hypothetical protein
MISPHFQSAGAPPGNLLLRSTEVMGNNWLAVTIISEFRSPAAWDTLLD